MGDRAEEAPVAVVVFLAQRPDEHGRAVIQFSTQCSQAPGCSDRCVFMLPPITRIDA
jgi:hypothetical protein